MICGPAAGDMTSTDDFDLGSTTVRRATHVSPWFCDLVIVTFPLRRLGCSISRSHALLS